VTDIEKLNQLNAMTQHLIGLQEAQASYIAIFLSGIFAFILVAHSAGAKLTTFQVTISSALFTLFAFVIGVRIVAFGAGINEMLIDLRDYQAASDLGRYELVEPSVRLMLASAVWSSGPIVALLFMWSVRHPKAE
jgi:hypothetical protein